jgi:hypothetical protein
MRSLLLELTGALARGDEQSGRLEALFSDFEVCEKLLSRADPSLKSDHSGSMVSTLRFGTRNIRNPIVAQKLKISPVGGHIMTDRFSSSIGQKLTSSY